MSVSMPKANFKKRRVCKLSSKKFNSTRKLLNSKKKYMHLELYKKIKIDCPKTQFTHILIIIPMLLHPIKRK